MRVKLRTNSSMSTRFKFLFIVFFLATILTLLFFWSVSYGQDTPCGGQANCVSYIVVHKCGDAAFPPVVTNLFFVRLHDLTANTFLDQGLELADSGGNTRLYGVAFRELNTAHLYSMRLNYGPFIIADWTPESKPPANFAATFSVDCLKYKTFVPVIGFNW